MFLGNCFSKFHPGTVLTVLLCDFRMLSLAFQLKSILLYLNGIRMLYGFLVVEFVQNFGW